MQELMKMQVPETDWSQNDSKIQDFYDCLKQINDYLRDLGEQNSNDLSRFLVTQIPQKFIAFLFEVMNKFLTLDGLESDFGQDILNRS